MAHTNQGALVLSPLAAGNTGTAVSAGRIPSIDGGNVPDEPVIWRAFNISDDLPRWPEY